MTDVIADYIAKMNADSHRCSGREIEDDNAGIEFFAKGVAAFRKQGNPALAAKCAAVLIERAPTVADLIREAGNLNNHPALVNTDHVTIMGMMDHAEMVLHVAKLRKLAA